MIEFLAFVYVFFTAWLLHELFHIKGHGISRIGMILVNEFGFTAQLFGHYDSLYFKLSGGILTFMVLFFLLPLTHPSPFSFGLFASGMIQFVYGLYEGFTKENKKHVRYAIYLSVFLICAIIWYAKDVMQFFSI